MNKIYAWFPCIDLTIKSLAAELKVLCERIGWYMVLTENMTFTVSLKWYSLKWLTWGITVFLIYFYYGPLQICAEIELISMYSSSSMNIYKIMANPA